MRSYVIEFDNSFVQITASAGHETMALVQSEVKIGDDRTTRRETTQNQLKPISNSET